MIGKQVGEQVEKQVSAAKEKEMRRDAGTRL